MAIWTSCSGAAATAARGTRTSCSAQGRAASRPSPHGRCSTAARRRRSRWAERMAERMAEHAPVAPGGSTEHSGAHPPCIISFCVRQTLGPLCYLRVGRPDGCDALFSDVRLVCVLLRGAMTASCAAQAGVVSRRPDAVSCECETRFEIGVWEPARERVSCCLMMPSPFSVTLDRVRGSLAHLRHALSAARLVSPDRVSRSLRGQSLLCWALHMPTLRRATRAQTFRPRINRPWSASLGE